MNDKPAAPLRHIFDLGDLSLSGSRVEVSADRDELTRLARWSGVEAVSAFGAQVELRRLAPARFAFDAELEADVVQKCVVTLEPVAAHIAKHVSRELHFSPHPRPQGGELTLAAGDQDVPEEIASLDYDLAAPLLEEFVLSIDPYPRKQGATFEPPAREAALPESPFAVLKKLGEQG